MENITRRNLIVKTINYIFFSIFTKFSFASNKKAKIIAIRFWPSSSYTRLTLESDTKLKYKYFYLYDPLRLVIDLEDVLLNDVIKNIHTKVLNDDYKLIYQVKVSQFKDNILRIVFYLNIKFKLQVFTLNPVSNYKDRFVVDFYPDSLPNNGSDDPLLVLLQDYNHVNSNDILDKTIREIVDKKNVQNSTKGNINEESSIELSQRDLLQNKKKVVVVIDPGHGGEDPGAIGKTGLKEKNIVLNIARLVKKKLSDKGYKVYMTRNEDIFIPLNVRVAKSRKLKGDVFVSIHTDAFPNSDVRGSGIFALSYKGATSSAAKYLANTQNSSDLIGGVIDGAKKTTDSAIYNTILDLTQTATINSSLLLGKIMLSELNKVNKLHKNYVDQANFHVLTAPDIPSILIETAFISNMVEEKLLSTIQFREKVATAISNGLVLYINKVS